MNSLGGKRTEDDGILNENLALRAIALHGSLHKGI